MHLGALKDQTSSPIAASSAPTVGWYAETDTKNIQEMAHDEYPGPLLNDGGKCRIKIAVNINFQYNDFLV